MNKKTKRKFYLENFNFTEKKINYKGKNLKTVYLHNIMDMFLHHHLNTGDTVLCLYSKYLKNVYGSKYNYYISFLMENNFLYLYKNYSVGRHSKMYAITKDVVKEMSKINTKNLKLSKHEYKKISIREVGTNPVSKQIVSSLFKVNIEKEESELWIEKSNLDYRKSILNKTIVEKIVNKDIYYIKDKYGRLHTNYTNLKKDIRNSFLTINGNRLREVDIKNSQPFFLYVLMKNNGYTEFDNFDKDVLSGKVYEELIKFSGEDISRNKVKKKVYGVIFGRNGNTKWNKIFQEKYPNVYNYIVYFKKINHGYKSLAHQLQKIESDFMFENLIPKLLNKLPDLDFITIHDSIMFEEQYYDIIEPIFNKTLMELY